MFLLERRHEDQLLRAAFETQASERAGNFVHYLRQQQRALALLSDWQRVRARAGGDNRPIEELAALARVLLAENPELYLLAGANRTGSGEYRVEWVEPAGERPLAVGDDLARNPILAPLLDGSPATWTAGVSKGVPCPEKEEDGLDVWLLEPVRLSDTAVAAAGAPQTILLAVMDIDDMMQRALGELAPVDLLWHLTGGDAVNGSQTLYASASYPALAAREQRWQRSIAITPTRAWLLSVLPGPRFIATHLHRHSWGMLAGGVSFALVLGALLVSLANRADRVEREVRERTVSLSREIAERETAEARLRESEGRYLALVETAEDLIFTAGLDERLLYVNTLAARRAGARPEDLVGVPIGLFAPSLPEAERHAIFTEVGAGRSINREFSVVFQGSTYWYDINLVPLRNDAGEVVAALGIGRDTTARREIEAQLKAAREAAETAARAKSDFLATMSHEIRTPLNGVIGTIGLLLDGPLAERQRELASIARESADILLALINDILDFSKIEADRLTLEPVAFEPARLLDEVVSLYAAQALDKGLELLASVAADVPSGLIGDEGRIRQVLLNLVGNAVKFTARGHVLVGLAALDREGGRVRLRFFVEDSGCGIPEQRRQELFERFVQGDASTTRRFGGSGLGLAISKRLAELMGGTLGVQSRPGGGSIFEFLLELPLDPEQPASQPKPADLTGLRALVVDDHQINRRVLVETLAGGGLRATAVCGGAEALELLRQGADAGDPFRIAVIDHLMPGLDGISLARAIKADSRLQTTLLALATSLTQSGEARLLREAGFAFCLVKPIQPARLLDLLAAAWALHLEGRDNELVSRPAPLGPRSSAPERLRAVASCRVLVAEDNAINQRVAVLTLESLGCRVDVAANGREAVSMVQGFPYDLVLMDCAMPEMDGYEATRAIRHDEKPGRRHLPIVAMTARAGPEDRERCLQAGMDDYVSKPVSPELLAAVLGRHLKPEAAICTASGTAHDTSCAVPDPPEEFSALDPLKTADLLRLCGGREPWKRLADLFESGTEMLLQRLRVAAASADEAELRASAHRLRGAAANIGAVVLAEYAGLLDRNDRAFAAEEAGATIEKLEREWVRVREALMLLRRD